MSDPGSSGPHDADWQRDLQRLREIYRHKLHGELATLDAKLREARDAAPAQPKLEVARLLAHRLKGTSGSYGLDECSAALARIEERLEHLPDAAQPDSDPAWAEIEQALEQARAGLE